MRPFFVHGWIWYSNLHRWYDYICRSKQSDVQKILKSESTKYFQWFHNLKASTGKSHAMLKTNHSLPINVKGNLLSNEKTVQLPGIIVDHKLSFESHLIDVCKNVSQKIQALATVSKFISQKKLILKKAIARAFITFQFS